MRLKQALRHKVNPVRLKYQILFGILVHAGVMTGQYNCTTHKQHPTLTCPPCSSANGNYFKHRQFKT